MGCGEERRFLKPRRDERVPVGMRVQLSSNNEMVPMSRAFKVQSSHCAFNARNFAIRSVVSDIGSNARLLRDASVFASDEDVDGRRP